jgi:hypothetical protein
MEAQTIIELTSLRGTAKTMKVLMTVSDLPQASTWVAFKCCWLTVR